MATYAAERPPKPPTHRCAAVRPTDDAWIIFTSGSTGVPKGVAVTHRSAAAFVDAESRIFLRHSRIRPGDRVLAGLSVAFDASCEEMWLAWAHGACLVPAPRALVRTGMDLGPWLVAQGITVVSTVPTLAALWPAEALEPVRLLIFGGEACPPELVARLATPEREVWNTYGPTEATVVACGALMTGEGPVRIGLPLDGWDLVVVDERELPVPSGATGQLIIGGVGLARYLDPAKDAEKFAPMPTLGMGAGLSIRRSRRQRPRGARLRRPRRRAGQARRSAHRARGGRRRPAGAARGHRRGSSRQDDSRGHPGARRLRRAGRCRRLRHRGGEGPAARGAARRARAAARRRRRAADAHLGQGRPRRAAVATARRRRGRRGRPRGDRGLARPAVDERARGPGRLGRRGLLRARRWQPLGGAARVAAASAGADGHRRRRL